MYSRIKGWFSVAAEVSKMSTYSGAHVGCIAVQSHRIVSSGYNTCKSDPLQKELNAVRFTDDETSCCNHSSHAEVMCIKPLIQSKCESLSKVSLYVSRVRKDGSTALARPCKSCMKAIKDSGIRWVYYTGDSEYFKEDVEKGVIYKLV